jgi:hypothetical protein
LEAFSTLGLEVVHYNNHGSAHYEIKLTCPAPTLHASLLF